MRIKYKMFIEKLWYERDIKRFNEIFKVDWQHFSGQIFRGVIA